jgi:DtxR family Mn-dependent transcriptional regulator
MFDLISALMTFAAIVLLGCILLWTGNGLVPRWLRMRARSERALLEDALKHLYDCQYRAQPATLHSLAGALGVSGNRSAELIRILESLGYLRSTETGPELTAEGSRYALQVIRMHRLWEQYLADQTGMAARTWHTEADRREHLMSSAETDVLATKLGNPRHDPHGDAIPTAAGEIDPPSGSPMTSLAIGQSAIIVHVEDEPQAVYDQLVAQSLVPGLKVRVTDVSSETVRFVVEGEEHALSPIVAANLTVLPIDAAEVSDQPFERLSALKLGETANVVRISPACRGVQLRRLLDLGFVPHTLVQAELRSPSGDPTAYRIRGSLIALRQEQANQICITRQMTEASPT